MATLRIIFVLLICFALKQNVKGGRNPNRPQTTPNRPQTTPNDLATPSSKFAINLYRQLASANQQGNFVLSPFSVFAALSMTLMGAGGTTKTQLTRALGLRPRNAVHTALRDYFTSVPSTPHPETNVTLSLANAAFYNARLVTLNAAFQRRLESHYGAGLKPFQHPNPETDINAWVNNVTKGAITKLLEPGSIDSATVLMLLNAVFFEAQWKNMFNKDITRLADFTTGTGNTVQVPMMSEDGAYSVKNQVPGLNARVLELPYKGDRFSLFIILPNSWDGVPQLESLLTSEILENVTNNMPRPSRYELYVPKFKVRMNKSLKESLQALGVVAIFGRASANLRPMLPPRDRRQLFVNEVKHEAMIEVTESGTRAAAVTSVSIGVTSLPPQFNVNQPFLFILRDKVAKINLFMGRVTDPSQVDGA